MFLKNIFLKTLRDYRFSILIWGGGLAVVLMAQAAAYTSLVSGPNKAATLADLKKAVESFSFLTGPVTDLDTFTGYVSYQFSRVPILILPIFGLLTGSALIRSEEERGSLDLLLSTPHSRRSVLLQKLAGLSLVLALIVIICWAGLLAGVVSVKGETIDSGAAFLACLNLGLLTLFFISLSLLLAQLTSRKVAASIAGGFFAGSYLLNNLLASVPALGWLRYFLPTYYESRSRPLAPSTGVQWWAMLVMLAAALVLMGGALWFYQRRDQGDVYHLGKARQVNRSRLSVALPRSGSVWLDSPFLFGVRMSLPGLIWWTLGIGSYIVVATSVLKDLRQTLVDLLQSDIYRSLGMSAAANNESLLSALIFVFAVVLFAAFAVIQVTSWTGEENEGRLELQLSVPMARWRLLLERFAASAVAAGLLCLLTGLIFVISTELAGASVATGKTFAAFFGLWVVCLVVEAGGFILAAFGPGWAVGVLGGLVALSYLADLLSSLLKLPDWAVNLSVFHQYGRPLLNGLDWPVQLIMLAVGGLLLAVAIGRFSQRDISH